MRRIESHFPSVRRPVRAARSSVIAVMLLLGCALAACGDDGGSGGIEEDRSYATDPEPAPTEAAVAATSSPDPTIVLPSLDQPLSSPEVSFIPVQPSVSQLFALIDGNVVVVDVHSGSSRIVARSTAEAEILHIEPVRDGTAVGVFRNRGGERGVFDFTLLAPDGSTQFSVPDISADLGAGNGKLRGSLAADWDAEGRRLAIVFPDGGGVVLHIGGTTEVLLTRGQAPAPMEVAWSPDGEAIAFTSRDLDDDSPYLAIGGMRVLPIDPVRIMGTGGRRPIHALTWEPDGQTLLAIQGSGNDPDAIGGDLIQVDRGTLSVRFALGGSRFGPGARIVMAEPAPDGQSWAIVTVAPGSGRGLQAAVWQSISVLTETSRLELGENPPVAGIAWTTAGITVTLFEGDEVRLVSFGPDGELTIPATPAASPEAGGATPIAFPIVELASPVASPAASPVASPDVEN